AAPISSRQGRTSSSRSQSKYSRKISNTFSKVFIYSQLLCGNLFSTHIILPTFQKDKDMGKRKNGGRRGEKNAVPPSAVGAYIPVTKAWKAGLGFLSRPPITRSEEHTSELQSRFDLVCRLLLDNKNDKH